MNWPGYPVRNPAASPPRTPDPFFPRNLHCFAPYGCFSYISDITLNAKQSYKKFGYEVKSHHTDLHNFFHGHDWLVSCDLAGHNPAVRYKYYRRKQRASAISKSLSRTAEGESAEANISPVPNPERPNKFSA